MPKGNAVTKDIENLYKRQTIHLLLYGFMTGVQWALPNTNRKEAAQAFLHKYNLMDNYSVEDILTTYHRINTDLINASKEKG